MISEIKHTMKTGSLIRLISGLEIYRFYTEDSYCRDGGDMISLFDEDLIVVGQTDIGMVVDDLIEEEEQYALVVLFKERLVRADCRVLRRVK